MSHAARTILKGRKWDSMMYGGTDSKPNHRKASNWKEGCQMNVTSRKLTFWILLQS